MIIKKKKKRGKYTTSMYIGFFSLVINKFEYIVYNMYMYKYDPSDL
jgi:hypothetical protein